MRNKPNIPTSAFFKFFASIISIRTAPIGCKNLIDFIERLSIRGNTYLFGRTISASNCSLMARLK